MFKVNTWNSQLTQQQQKKKKKNRKKNTFKYIYTSIPTLHRYMRSVNLSTYFIVGVVVIVVRLISPLNQFKFSKKKKKNEKKRKDKQTNKSLCLCNHNIFIYVTS